MGLLKAMAAQIEVSQTTMNNPAIIEVHLICTFRYESELYAYGDFMHRITHDPRFTSWLHTQIYVSRPDKMAPLPLCESGLCTSEFVCGRVDDVESGQGQGDEGKDQESAPLLAGIKESKLKYGSVASRLNNAATNGRRVNVEEQNDQDCCMGCGVECSGGSGSTSSSSSSLAATISVSPPSNSRADSASTLTGTPRNNNYSDDNGYATKALLNGASASTALAAAAFTSGCYRYKTLPTFPAANSAAIATIHAKKDLFLTTLILVLPMLAYLWGRAFPWEGTYKGEYRWCRTTKDTDQHMTNRCMWSYAILPGVVHVLAASCVGYFALFVARKTNLFRASSSHGGRAIAATASVAETNNAAFSSYAKLIRGLGGDSATYAAAVSGSATLHRHGVMKAAVKKQQGIEFKRGRIQVNHHIQELISLGVGHRRSGGKGIDETEALFGGAGAEEVKTKEGGVIVFGGGPDAFVDMIEESCKKAGWVVDFHRETWAP